jgi:large subunit ribosomal protein L35Ae
MAKTAQKTVKRSSAPTRLWVKGRFLSFRRSRDRLECQQSLVKLQDVNDRKGLRYYHGKRVAYVYRAHKSVANTKYRVVWGKIMRAHGDNGLALCKFRKNLPARAIGDSVRVFLYPQRGQSVLTQA